MNLSTLILVALGAGIVFGALLNGFFPALILPLVDILTAVNGRRFPNLTIWVSASFPKDFSHLP
jgi:hypothetical protein